MPYRACGAMAALIAMSALPAATQHAFAQTAQPMTLTFGQPQTAGISGFRRMWDAPLVLDESGVVEVVDRGEYGKARSAFWFPEKRDNGGRPGALVFDAQHRSLLVRFPGVAQKVASQMTRGYTLSKVEVLLPFRDTEMWPEGYKEPSGLSFMGDLWARNPPQWHAVAWALRQPWVADAWIGPTYNAYINGSGYWKKYGAQDEKQDRFPTRFGPAEVSHKNPQGRLDVTAMLRDAAFGATPQERLRRFESCGLLVRKWETYDVRYHQGGYEWGVATAGRGILIHPPKLVVTLAPGAKAMPLRTAELAAADVPALAAQLQRNKTGGKPTAVMPSAAQIKVLSQKYGFHRPDWMPGWQWQRVSELKALGGFTSLPDTPEAYNAWIDDMLSLMPRRWDGWDVPDKLQLYYLYAAAWPEPVRQFWHEYWTAWLMPWRETKDFAHVQANATDERGQESIFQYYARTGDWRGNVSFYRYSYTQTMSTMNFNHTAALGALLGGGIIGSRRAMEDGRHGLETWPLRTWSWFDGSTQESLDHYYFAISLKDQKMFADFGPTQLDRMMGRSMLAKSVEELTSSYHPGLRRFIAPSGRTGPAYVFVQQDGAKHIVHTLSRAGALTDIGNKEIYGGMQPLGHDALPGMIAQQTLNGPWAPEWVANMVDEKPLPYQMTNSYKQWGSFSATPLWKRNYLGRNYGVASVDLDTGGTVPLMAQWRRAAKTVETMDEIATLLIRPGVNRTNLLDSQGGIVGQFGGMATLQHKNKMIVLTSPWKKERYPAASVTEVKSLQTTLGLFNFQKNPTWEIFVDGKRVTAYPVKVKAGQRIAIHDGVSYTGIIPLPSTDLGRSDEVVITDQTGPMIKMQGGGEAKPTLLIEQYNLKQDAPLADNADWAAIDQAYGGFAIELGDATEYKDFAAFQQHLNMVKLDTRWDKEKKQLSVSYRSGADRMETGFRPDYSGGGTDQLFPYRRVNGAWPYNPPGIDRDSSLTQQGTSGKLEKNGATLTTEAGRMAYLQSEPITGTFAGFNPFPDPTLWSLSVPGDVMVKANGRLGLARIIVRPKENKLWVDYALREDQRGRSDMATALLVFGFKGAPLIEFNGQRLYSKAVSMNIDGQRAYVVPLGAKPSPAASKASAKVGG